MLREQPQKQIVFRTAALLFPLLYRMLRLCSRGQALGEHGAGLTEKAISSSGNYILSQVVDFFKMK
jgi:hypothetical protein